MITNKQTNSPNLINTQWSIEELQLDPSLIYESKSSAIPKVDQKTLAEDDALIQSKKFFKNGNSATVSEEDTPSIHPKDVPSIDPQYLQSILQNVSKLFLNSDNTNFSLSGQITNPTTSQSAHGSINLYFNFQPQSKREKLKNSSLFLQNKSH